MTIKIDRDEVLEAVRRHLFTKGLPELPADTEFSFFKGEGHGSYVPANVSHLEIYLK